MMRSRRSGFILLMAIPLAAGCATRADFERVRRDQQEMRALLADTQVAVDKLNRRLDTLKAGGDDADVARTGQALRRIESRLAALEAQRAGQGAVLTVPVESAPVAAPVAGGPSLKTEAAVIALRREQERLASGNLDEAYRRGIELYRQGQAEESIQQFREYLRNNPKSDLADDAQFWVGEAYYSQGDYNRSIIELNEVLLKYPQGDRVPGALLALATSFANSGDKIDARLILQKLIDSHRNTEEAQVGRQQLQALAD
jgi:tol-pal system protein YbgF